MVEPGEVLAELGRRLRAARRARAMTLAGLAARVGTVKGYLSAIERGRRPPPGVCLSARLERALGLASGEVARVSAWWRAGPLRAEVSPWGGRRSGWVEGVRAVPGLIGAAGVVLVSDMGGSPVVLAGDWVIVGPVGETGMLRSGGFAAVVDGTVGRGVRVWRFAGVAWPGVGRVMPVLGLIKPLSAVTPGGWGA